MTLSAIRRLISREVERVATRKSRVFILRTGSTLYSVRTICPYSRLCQDFFPACESFFCGRLAAGQVNAMLAAQTLIRVAAVDGNLPSSTPVTSVIYSLLTTDPTD